MNRIIIPISLVLIFICLAGCTQKELKTPLEDVGMVGIMALDYIDEETTKLTVAIPQFSSDAEEPAEIFSVTTDLISKGIIEIEERSDKKVVLNQLRVVLLNEEFARNGKVRKVIQDLYGNSEVGNKVLISVVKENGEEMIKAKYPDKQNINFYVNNLLEASINTAFNPNTNIHDFMYTQTNPVFDSIVPYLEKKESNIKLEGVALFKGGNMIDSISPKEALLIQLLQGRKNLTPMSLTLNVTGSEERVLLDLFKGKAKIKSNKNLNSPVVTISLKLDGTLIEYKGEREKQLKSKEDIKNLEKDINEQVKKDIHAFWGKLKELEVDPIGLAENFRMYYKGDWTKEKTVEINKRVQLDIHVETSIISKGTLK